MLLTMAVRSSRFLIPRFLHSGAPPQATGTQFEGSRPLDFRTSETNPVNHTDHHAGRFYTIQPDVKKLLFQHGGFPTAYEKQIKTFAETCIMVREPAIELLHYLKSADYSKPAIRYVLYGPLGAGKSLTLAHILHYGLVSGFLLVHVPWLPNWMRRSKEVANSTTREGCVDLPLDAAAWLVHFKCQNAALLAELDLKVTKDHVWSKRETTKSGAPLLELVDLGINRVKYASDCLIEIIKELKTHSTQGRCKTLVVIDGFNALFHPKTRVLTEEKVLVTPSKISITSAFIDITKYDWCNGAVVVTADRNAVAEDRQASDLPFYQLGREGFEHLDPFLPIQVPKYSNKELESCLEYYCDRRWLQSDAGHTEDGRKELAFLSDNNPYKLMNLCASL